MIHTKVVTETVERTWVDKITCDRCGAEALKSTSAYDVHRFRLSYEEGTVYPEGGSTSGWRVDLCADCIEWLKLILEGNGVKLQPTDTEV